MKPGRLAPVSRRTSSASVGAGSAIWGPTFAGDHRRPCRRKLSRRGRVAFGLGVMLLSFAEGWRCSGTRDCAACRGPGRGVRGVVDRPRRRRGVRGECDHAIALGLPGGQLARERPRDIFILLLARGELRRSEPAIAVAWVIRGRADYGGAVAKATRPLLRGWA